MNNILFILSYTIFPVFELELSLIQEKIDENNKITLLHCNSDQKYCSANNFKSLNYKKIKTLCTYCTDRYRNGLQWLGYEKKLKYENYFLVNEQQKKEIKNIESVLNSNEFLNESIIKMLIKDNLDVLNICKTTLSVKYQNLNINLNDHYEELKPIIINCLNSYYSAVNQINKHKPNEIYIFNGRDCYFQPAMRAAQRLINKDKIFIYEFPDFGGFEGLKITKGTYPHDIEKTSMQAHEKYQSIRGNLNKNIIFSRAKNILKDRYEQKFDSYVPWRPNQKIKKLPEKFDDKKKKISIFTASEYEIRYIPENENLLDFKNQLELIKEILNGFINLDNIQFYLRLHPNQKNENEKYLHELKCYNNLEIIRSDSKINSYDLGLNSNFNVVINSTIGLEFIAMGKQTIIVGPTLYQHFINTLIFFDKKIIIEKVKDYIINEKQIVKFVDQEKALEALYALESFIYKTKYVEKKNLKSALMHKNKIYKSIDSNFFLKSKVNMIYIFRKLLKYFKINL
jgi:hypothetical protein